MSSATSAGYAPVPSTAETPSATAASSFPTSGARGCASYVEEDGSGVVHQTNQENEKFVDEADQLIRQGFVKKVFGLLGVQLAVTSAIIAFFSLYEPVTKYVDVQNESGHPWVFMTATFVSFACILSLACFPHQARVYPNNYAFLGVFTLAESVLLGVVCAAFTASSILIAGAVTSLITLGLVAFAFTTKRDFTGAGPYLFMALWCLILYGFMLSFIPALRSSMQTAYSFIGVVIFSFYIVYDVQLIIGGKHHKYRFGIDEHVFATLNIYLDVINLFIRILQMFGDRR